jgi:hypothetical protein
MVCVCPSTKGVIGGTGDDGVFVFGVVSFLMKDRLRLVFPLLSVLRWRLSWTDKSFGESVVGVLSKYPTELEVSFVVVVLEVKGVGGQSNCIDELVLLL